MRFLEREGDFRRGGPRPNYCDQRQQVTWMRAIFLSRDRLKLSIASVVGCRITRQRFLSKYALASGDNRTFPSWPAPTINTALLQIRRRRGLMGSNVGGAKPCWTSRAAILKVRSCSGRCGGTA